MSARTKAPPAQRPPKWLLQLGPGGPAIGQQFAPNFLHRFLQRFLLGFQWIRLAR